MHTTASVVLEDFRVQDRTMLTENEVEGLNQQRSTKIEPYLGGSEGPSSSIQDGIVMWPNASTWMQAESRSESILRD